MEIKFKKLNSSEIAAFEIISSWDNDKEIKPYLIPNLNGKLDDGKNFSPEILVNNYNQNENKTIYLILDKDKIIGSFSIDIGFPYIIKKGEKTAWISICIGNKDYWGSGAAVDAMNYIEKLCEELGLRRIELGVFEFNKRAQSFYEKLGYKAIAIIKNFTYYNENWYDDIRMEKYIIKKDK